jgi:hypothetical protein
VLLELLHLLIMLLLQVLLELLHLLIMLLLQVLLELLHLLIMLLLLLLVDAATTAAIAPARTLQGLGQLGPEACVLRPLLLQLLLCLMYLRHLLRQPC